MSAQCPQDGGFIGGAGCSHRNHTHSEFLTTLLDAPAREITTKECDTALEEGFYVDSADGSRVGFGKSLKHHLVFCPTQISDCWYAIV